MSIDSHGILDKLIRDGDIRVYVLSFRCEHIRLASWYKRFNAEAGIDIQAVKGKMIAWGKDET